MKYTLILLVLLFGCKKKDQTPSESLKTVNVVCTSVQSYGNKLTVRWPEAAQDSTYTVPADLYRKCKKGSIRVTLTGTGTTQLGGSTKAVSLTMKVTVDNEVKFQRTADNRIDWSGTIE